jgi:hypothetical protein
MESTPTKGREPGETLDGGGWRDGHISFVLAVGDGNHAAASVCLERMEMRSPMPQADNTHPTPPHPNPTPTSGMQVNLMFHNHPFSARL